MLFYLFFLAVLLLLAAVAGEDEPLFCVFFALLAAMQVFALLISPLYFVFSRDEVRIMCFFGIKEVIPWDSVRSISLTGAWIDRVDGFPRYSFSYPVYCKQPFFVLGEIPKTIRTKSSLKGITSTITGISRERAARDVSRLPTFHMALPFLRIPHLHKTHGNAQGHAAAPRGSDVSSIFFRFCISRPVKPHSEHCP